MFDLFSISLKFIWVILPLSAQLLIFSMANRLHIERLCNVRSLKLLYVVAFFVIFSRLLVIPYENYISILSYANIGMMFTIVSNTTISSKSQFAHDDIGYGEVNDTRDSGLDEEAFLRGREGGRYTVYKSSQVDGGRTGALLENASQLPSEFAAGSELTSDKLVKVREFEAKENHPIHDGLKDGVELTEQVEKSKANATESLAQNANASASLIKPLTTRLEFFPETSYALAPCTAVNVSLLNNGQKDLLQTGSVSLNNNSVKAGKCVWKKSNSKPMSISDMNTILHNGSTSANSLRPQMFSARDKELQNARIQIESAPIIRNAPSAYTSLFRNYSMFIRSYELMERVLRVYIYKEGQRPIFHQPHLTGIYASEGWFMKLMEGNRQFVVRDPGKAHLFYLPFSAQRLRDMLYKPNFTIHKDLEIHLNGYVRDIARKYNFWNRTKGADHFLVACHDWGPRFARHSMRSCLRALCNSNMAKGFQIGKDVSLPVTSIRSAKNPANDNGGNHPLERPNLAFFAGGMHGYLRPILLHYWSDKEPDMKIFGALPRDTQGKAQYREFMKSSKYCICARGYQVHTPRVMESVYYECVPVIISDDYVPPLFEIFEWESFAVFVLEEDVPNLRNILVSITEKRYREMQKRLKLVQQHFVWHKIPVKYDLFHMILHSIWYNRVFSLKS